MKKRVLLLFLVFSLACNSKADRSKAFVPASSGNLNHVTIVMQETDWKSTLGEQVREEMSVIYEGLPLDEPQFSLRYMNPKAFTHSLGGTPSGAYQCQQWTSIHSCHHTDHLGTPCLACIH